MLAEWQVAIYIDKHIHVSLPTCRPADLICVDLYVYPYRSMYIQANINDKPCMYIQDEK